MTLPVVGVIASSPQQRDFTTLHTSGVVKYADETSSAATQQLRQVVETQLRRRPKPRAFVLFFETEPMWLLALDRNYVSTIFIPDHRSFHELGEFLHSRTPRVGWYHASVSRFGRRTFSFGMPPDQETPIALTCGSEAFCLSVAKRWMGAGLYVIPEPFSVTRRRRGKPVNSTITWHKVRHVVYGGATDFQGFVGSAGDLALTPHISPLRRYVRHFISFGDMGDGRIAPDAPVIGLDDLVPAYTSEVVVTYASPRVRSGRLERMLSTKELANVYGLPAWLHHGVHSPELFPVVPIQILAGWITPQLHDRTTFAMATRLLPPRTAPPEPTLPLLGKPLPLSWIDPALITDKAVKADDAEIPSGTWDQRILLVFPHATEPALGVLRAWLKRVSLRRMAVEGLMYLKGRFGTMWWEFQETRQGGGRHIRQGAEPIPTGRIDLEVTAIREALVRLDASTWWNWSGGSSLYHWRWPIGLACQAALEGFEYFGHPNPHGTVAHLDPQARPGRDRSRQNHLTYRARLFSFH